MDFGEVLSRAWRIIWKHKVLWIFGIMAGCAGSGGGSTSVQYQFGSSDIPPQFQAYFEQFPQEQILLWSGIAVLVVLILAAISIFLGTVGRIGIIRGALQVEQATAKLTFSELFRGSLPYFWRVFALVLLVSIVIIILSMLMIVPVVLLTALTFGLILLCLLPLLCLLVPLSWLVQAYIELGIVSIVADNLGVIAGLQRAWDIFKTKIGQVILMALILILGVGGIGSLIIGAPLLLVLSPLIAGVIASAENVFMVGALISILCLVIYLPVLLVLNGILRSYINTAWTLTYLRLTPMLTGGGRTLE
jgi:hypothetical protein